MLQRKHYRLNSLETFVQSKGAGGGKYRQLLRGGWIPGSCCEGKREILKTEGNVHSYNLFVRFGCFNVRQFSACNKWQA